LIVVIAAVTSGGGRDKRPVTAADGSASSASTGAPAGRAVLYPERPDRHAEDQEAAVGEPVRLGGYTATVTAAELAPGLLDERVLVVHVRVENRDDRAQPYNVFDWRIQDSAGRVLDPTPSGRDDGLGSGDLVHGGVASGTVAFGVGPGTYYVIYKPKVFDAARGVWKITV
jgi:hypothetical protein